MRFRHWLIASALWTLGSAVASASNADPGEIQSIHYISDGVVIIYHTGTRTAVPSCATSQPTRFAIDASTDGGKSQLAGIQMAYALGKQIAIVGTGACGFGWATEAIAYFRIVD